MDDLKISQSIAASGLKAQATRLRVVSENLANADSMATKPGGNPYRRRVVTFRNELDGEMGANKVHVNRVANDRSEFGRKYEPDHPAAGEDGYILTPNVNPLVEMMDMREAQRSYEANLGVIRASKDMMAKTIDLLR